MSNTVIVNWECIDTVNYAMQQNHVAVIRNLVMTNTTDIDLTAITIKLIAEPFFAYEWTKSFDILPAGQSIHIGAVPLQMSSRYLSEMTERSTGMLKLVVLQEDAVLFEKMKTIDLLSFDEWSGLAVLPEMIAAFVTPNHPVVGKLISEASKILGQWSGNPSLNAYQSKDPNRVKLQAAALYSVLQQHQITYCVAPPSFEMIGQRVRLPDTVITNKLGNCLDLSLLYAACMEAVGLHPLVIFIEGHAFVGVWLIEETFSESVQDDVTLLTKRMVAGINEICIVEATAFVTGQSISFDEAIKLATAHLNDQERFDCFVDIRRARYSSIRPLPLRVPTTDGIEIQMEETYAEEPENAQVPEQLDSTIMTSESGHTALTKQKQWERRLLDLTMRNALINLRLSKSSIPLMAVHLEQLEDNLAEHDQFEILARPSDWQDDVRNTQLFQSVGSADPLNTLLQEEFSRNRLRANLPAMELEKRLAHLYRSSRLSIEENGANTLYLALGLLKWYESDVSELTRYAPLVLIPVDILRKSSRQGYIIRMRDEDPQMNITLLEMLRQDWGIDISGVDPLPKDERGIDLKLVFTVIRRAVMQRSRWDVEEIACLGLFSFGQFVMWNDIRTRSKDIAGNKIVASLMAGQLQWIPDQPSETALDDEAMGELFVPISADSSQLEAIRASVSDQSFVLHGPPGTGKSQTITNMIASALANGKRVLFIAEKMAALSVVQRRLEQIGLGAFCLELHSNKSSKKAVLDQLQSAVEVAKRQSSEQWTVQGSRLASLRSELNGYVEALHKQYPFGFTLYEAIAAYEKVGDCPDVVVFRDSIVTELTEEKITHWKNVARQISVAVQACGGLYDNPWRLAKCSSYSQQFKEEVDLINNRYGQQVISVQQAFIQAAQQLGWAGIWQPNNKVKNELFYKICKLLLLIPYVPTKLLQSADLDSDARNIKKAAEQGKQRDMIRDQVCARFQIEILRFDAKGTLDEWNKQELKWFLAKWSGQNRVYKLLQSMLKPEQQMTKAQVPELLNQVIQWQEEEQKLKAAGEKVTDLLGSAWWEDSLIKWDALELACDWTMKFHNLLIHLFQQSTDILKARQLLAERLMNGSDTFMIHYGAMLKQVVTVYDQYIELEHTLFDLLTVDFKELEEEISTEDTLSVMQRKSKEWGDHIHRLRDWCTWRRVRDEAEEAGLISLIVPIESGLLAVDQVTQSFERGLYKACANHIISNDNRLSQFSGNLFEEKIERFVEMDRRFEHFTREEIYVRLASKVPVMSLEAAQNSEAGILQRAVRSGGRGISIRKLFESIPNLLPRLAPCMLMSPISVAQYLDPSAAKFDLVIYDEASQVPTAEAVGALARGNNAIIVGDPKQLPPTSFFSKMNTSDEEDEVSMQDLESILDDCLALGMPQRHLTWHYRSRHESLISFSNAYYYDNKLMTFPSPEAPVSNVKWCPVDGFYDRGRSKKNMAEGRAVVDEIVRRLKDDHLRKQSIGVVTFNSIQQTLIEDLLEEAFLHDSELETLEAKLPEPIFIKNLENVQGDERDVILFSVGYGPDATGKVTMNFGPLNREGGWRRLNVAVSRARHEMMVFSTLQPHHLNAGRTSSQGVMGLKAFLEYAEKGIRALPSAEAVHYATDNMDLHRSIAKKLMQLGYQAKINVGTSGYRIDLGVLDPENSDKYLLGIILDGPVYRDAKTARDREILRNHVLEQLGWKLHHVWALDWWDNADQQIKMIEQAISTAKSGQFHNEDASKTEEKSISESNKLVESFVTHLDNPEQLQNKTISLNRLGDSIGLPEGASYYVVSQLNSVGSGTDLFYATEYTATIREQIVKVIEEEAPISRSLLVKRVIHAWGITRTGTRIERRVDDIMHSMMIKTTKWEDVIYYWSSDQDANVYSNYRLSLDDADRRSAEELPPEEVANAIHYILRSQISLPQDELIRQTTKLLGYARTGTALEKKMQLGLTSALERKLAARDKQGRIVLQD